MGGIELGLRDGLSLKEPLGPAEFLLGEFLIGFRAE
jgi:hypothetical protein